MEERIQNLESRISALEAQNINNQIQNLEKQLSKLEDKVENSEAKKLYDLAETSFKTVLDADIHLDNKASRILSAMAFLTAASAAIFAKAYSPNLITQDIQQKLIHSLSSYINSSILPSVINATLQDYQKQNLVIFGLDLALFSFAFYILFVLLGSGLYLYAIGPSLNIPSWLRNSNNREVNNSVKSLLFFKSISSVEQKIWQTQWQGESNKIQDIIKDNFLQESYLIAQKATTKDTLMSGGSLFFRLAIAFLIPLVFSLLSLDSDSKILAIYLGLFLLLCIYVYADFQRPSKDRFASWIPVIIWSLLAFLCLLNIIHIVFK
jgi:hypothetical protein